MAKDGEQIRLTLYVGINKAGGQSLRAPSSSPVI
jgi:hypothetical protein